MRASFLPIRPSSFSPQKQTAKLQFGGLKELIEADSKEYKEEAESKEESQLPMQRTQSSPAAPIHLNTREFKTVKRTQSERRPGKNSVALTPQALTFLENNPEVDGYLRAQKIDNKSINEIAALCQGTSDELEKYQNGITELINKTLQSKKGKLSGPQASKIRAQEIDRRQTVIRVCQEIHEQKLLSQKTSRGATDSPTTVIRTEDPETQFPIDW
ncbi:MAG: hypothetical protein AAGI66_01745 [Cyanobacteria bacterium P01_H01_bin.74]